MTWIALNWLSKQQDREKNYQVTHKNRYMGLYEANRRQNDKVNMNSTVIC